MQAGGIAVNIVILYNVKHFYHNSSLLKLEYV